MILEFDDKNVERVKELLAKGGIDFELRDSAFESCTGINIFETLTHIFDRNPEIDGEMVPDEIYRRTPKLVSKIADKWVHDKSYGVEDSPLMELDGKIYEVYTAFIKEEIEEMKKEGLISE